jgi:hypothetical protein
MSTTKQRHSSKERLWRRMVRQWRRSGLSIRCFCAERQLSEPSFYAWRRTIAERDAEGRRSVCHRDDEAVRSIANGDAEATRFVPVQVVSDENLAATDASGRGLELLLGSGRVLRIGPGFDGPTLQRLLALLEEGRP